MSKPLDLDAIEARHSKPILIVGNDNQPLVDAVTSLGADLVATIGEIKRLRDKVEELEKENQDLELNLRDSD